MRLSATVDHGDIRNSKALGTHERGSIREAKQALAFEIQTRCGRHGDDECRAQQTRENDENKARAFVIPR